MSALDIKPEDLIDGASLVEAIVYYDDTKNDDWDWPTCNECSAEVELAHNGDVIIVECPERRWHGTTKAQQRFLELIGDVTPLRIIARPVIRLDGPDHIAQVPDALDALARHGNVYRYGDRLVAVERATGRVHPLGAAGVKTQLARAAIWTKRVYTSREGKLLTRREEVAMPRDMGQLVLGGLDEWYRLPELDLVVRVPTLLPDGSILSRRGYDASSRAYFAPDDGLESIETNMPVEAAVALINDDLFGDFPFVSDADRAHAFALLLLPFLRLAIDGPTPLHWVDAKVSRTGKGLLVRCALIPGHDEAHLTKLWAPDDKELGKNILATLIEGAPAINFDNVRGQVRSAALEAALTASTWTDRVLGGSSKWTGSVKQVWTLTANNGRFGGDLAGRIVPIQLDAKMEDPSERTGFRHTQPAWAVEHRAELVSAALSLCRAWVGAGRPNPGKEIPVLGGYESWHNTVGGVLKVAGVPGFLSNRTEFKMRDEDTANLRRLYEAMHQQHDDSWWRANDALPLGLPGGSSARELAANWLQPNKTRPLGGLRLEYNTRQGGTGKWRVVPVDASNA